MNHSLLDPEVERQPADYSDEREISLGPGTILGIFFVLALICACFFGFGYSVGHRSAQTAAIQPVVMPTSSAARAPKPTAGSIAPVAQVEQTQTETPAQPAAAPEALPIAPRPAPAQAATPPSVGTTPGNTTGSFMVQVAAVSSQEIADIEVSALKKDGYNVMVRREPQDKLLHVQIGPFSDRKAADDMRKRVQADGFNAIVK